MGDKQTGYCREFCSKKSWWLQLKVAKSQKVFLIWSHCQQKVPNYSPEQKIWISCLLKTAGEFKFSTQGIDLALFVGNGTKLKIPSEIKPPLNFNCSWNYTISWNYQSGVLSICAGTNKARQRRSRSNLSIVSDVCHATDFIFSSFFQLTIACFGALIYNDFYRFIITYLVTCTTYLPIW